MINFSYHVGLQYSPMKSILLEFFHHSKTICKFQMTEFISRKKNLSKCLRSVSLYVLEPVVLTLLVQAQMYVRSFVFINAYLRWLTN